MKRLNIYNDLKKLCKGLFIKKNYDLKDYNSYKIPAKVFLFIEPKNLEEVLKVCKYLQENKQKFVVLGNGSNILFLKPEDKIVLRLSNKFANIFVNDNKITAYSGASLNAIISIAKQNNLKGIEDGVGIPGTIGGAVTMNVSAYSFEISKIVRSVVAIIDGKVKIFEKKDCLFDYRKSIFQKLDAVVLRVELELEKDNNFNFQERINFIINKRMESQPLKENSAGSVFKNLGEIKVAKLIEDAGLKGFSIGGAKVSGKHSNFIVTNNATAEDVYNLISYIKKVIKKKYNLKLETEIKIIK